MWAQCSLWRTVRTKPLPKQQTNTPQETLYIENSSKTCQGFSSGPREPLFKMLWFPHLLKQPSGIITCPQIQDLSQVKSLTLSTPPLLRQNKPKTMRPLKVSFGVVRNKWGQDSFGEAMEAILRSTRH